MCDSCVSGEIKLTKQCRILKRISPCLLGGDLQIVELFPNIIENIVLEMRIQKYRSLPLIIQN